LGLPEETEGEELCDIFFLLGGGERACEAGTLRLLQGFRPRGRRELKTVLLSGTVANDMLEYSGGGAVEEAGEKVRDFLRRTPVADIRSRCSSA
jgi:hypothetical protein